MISNDEGATLANVAYNYGRCSAVLESPWERWRLNNVLHDAGAAEAYS